jgi:2-(1,2-epoxy-1,2-dihydrophenyl)acetyl-CoA isomerase
MSSILSEIQNHLAIVKFNRPEVYNSFNREMALNFIQELEGFRDNPEVRAIYITGMGKAFSAGQDLKEVTDPEGPEISTIVSEHYNPIIHLLRDIEKPIVCAVNGVAAGAGANIALAGDIVVAHESASFIQAFSKIGLIPDSGGTWTLPRLVGFQKASALMMLGEKVSAEEAERLGMIYKVLSADEFEQSALALAQKLSTMPTKGLGLTKRALNQSFENSLDAQLGLEDILQTEASNSFDYREGVAAFLDKRKPKFKGN